VSSSALAAVMVKSLSRFTLCLPCGVAGLPRSAGPLALRPHLAVGLLFSHSSTCGQRERQNLVQRVGPRGCGGGCVVTAAGVEFAAGVALPSVGALAPATALALGASVPVPPVLPVLPCPGLIDRPAGTAAPVVPAPSLSGAAGLACCTGRAFMLPGRTAARPRVGVVAWLAGVGCAVLCPRVGIVVWLAGVVCTLLVGVA
jgi:hypothetical protein